MWFSFFLYTLFLLLQFIRIKNVSSYYCYGELIKKAFFIVLRTKISRIQLHNFVYSDPISTPKNFQSNKKNV